jgi:uncharacterized protein YndB with AHSA1/START domain
MKIALIALVALIAVIAIVVAVGALLPKQHHVTRAARFHEQPEAVWAAIINYREFPAWRSNVKSVEPVESKSALPAWREIDSHGQSLPMQTLEADPPRRLVTEIADPSLPFGGTWAIEITPTGSGSLVRITEDGEVRNPIFRFMSRFVFGQTATMNAYLSDLGKKFGEKIQSES